MKSKLSTLGFVLILSALIFSGCSLPTPQPTPTPGPTPTPAPVQAPGWEEVTVDTLCLDVEQSFPEIEGKSPEPIAEEVQGILAWVGIQAVAEGEPCDTTLTITLACEAIGAWYNQRTRYCYSGAQAHGEMVLAASGRAPFTFTMWGSISPPDRLWHGCPKPIDAPFESAWRGAVIRGLAHLWGPQLFIQALERREWVVCNYAAAELSEIGPEAMVETVPALIQALLSDDYSIMARTHVAAMLAEIGPEAAEAVPALIQALGDESEDVRGAAARALGQIGPEAAEAIPALIQTLGDGYEDVQVAAASALAEIGPEAAGPDLVETVPALIEALGAKNMTVRGLAAELLAEIGPEAAEVVPALIQALGDESEDVRREAAEALGRIGPEAVEAVPALVQALGDGSEYVRREAAEALGRIGPEAAEAVSALIQTLGEENSLVRREVAEALKTITGQDFGKDAAAWEQWWEDQQSPIPIVTPTFTPAIAAQTPSPVITPTFTPVIAAQTPVPGVITYTVQAGDTLSEIAKEFEVTVEAIVEANDIEDPSLIRVGQALVIPLAKPKE